MKLLAQEPEQFVFELIPPEKFLLTALLKLFPLVPATHHRLSRNTADIPDAAANQRLLEESIQAQKAGSQHWVAALLAEPDRFKSVPAGFQFTVTRTELEGLLQVLNDVRIGSWLALGSPDLEREEELQRHAPNAVHLQRMQIAGHFEMSFLNAVSGAGTD